MFLLFVVLFLCFLIIGLVVYQHKKLTGAILISFPLFFIFLVCGWWVLASNHYFVPSTNLKEESIGEYSLEDTLTKESIYHLESFEKRENNNGYSYTNEDFFLSTDRKNKNRSISTGAPSIETSSGLKVGDTLESAKCIYGDHYYTYKEMGLGKATVYVDRNNKYLLTIWTKDEQFVSNIWLSTY